MAKKAKTEAEKKAEAEAKAKKKEADARAEGEKEVTSNDQVNQNVRHDGKRYVKGDKITDPQIKKIFAEKGYLGKLGNVQGIKTDKGIQASTDDDK